VLGPKYIPNVLRILVMIWYPCIGWPLRNCRTIRSRRPFISFDWTSFELFNTYLPCVSVLYTNTICPPRDISQVFIEHKRRYKRSYLPQAYQSITKHNALVHSLHNLNKPKHEQIRNRTHSEREPHDGNLQKRTCTTHHQKPARHPNTKAHQSTTNVGIQDQKTSRSQIQRNTPTRRTLPPTQRPGTGRLPDQSKRTTRRKNQKSLHNDPEREGVRRSLRRHTKGTNTETRHMKDA